MIYDILWWGFALYCLSIIFRDILVRLYFGPLLNWPWPLTDHTNRCCETNTITTSPSLLDTWWWWPVFSPLQPGVLPLEPGPLYAIDGDSGINEQLTYSFLSGKQLGPRQTQRGLPFRPEVHVHRHAFLIDGRYRSSSVRPVFQEMTSACSRSTRPRGTSACWSRPRQWIQSISKCW